MFDGLNNQVLYPFHDCIEFVFADKFGFTKEEVTALCLIHAFWKNDPTSSVLDRIDQASSYYNGYVATDQYKHAPSSVQVYNPGSIVRFVSTSTLGNYWLETTAIHSIMSHLFTKLYGTVRSSILGDICCLMSRFERPRLTDDLKEDATSFRANKPREQWVSLFREPQSQLHYEKLDRIISGLSFGWADQLWSYLYMAGCLAAIPLQIVDVDRPGWESEKLVLQYFIPNEEVYNAWKKCILDSSQESVD